MKRTVNHPTYGKIVYEEKFWSGKNTLTVGGVEAEKISKRSFMFGGRVAALKGNIYKGVKLFIGGEGIEIVSKLKWYEVILSILPFVFIMVWGNSPELCNIFPIVGGAVGGAIGGLALALSIWLMKKRKWFISKLICAAFVFLLAVCAAAAVACLFLFLVA